MQAKLSFDKDFKHCNIITYDGDIFIATEFDSCGIHQRKVKALKTSALLRALKHIDGLIALVVVDIKARRVTMWKPYFVRSCNELDRYISGVNIGFTFNPKHLYNKLIKCNGTDYDVLYSWRR